jgi:hypothetical protein
MYKESSPIKLIVHINDKNLSTLFSKSFILDNNNKINIKTFSYFEECARDLFDQYSLDGDTMDYMDSHKTLKTILLGDGESIKRIVHKIITLSHFPNQNKHKIYIVHKDASSLLEEIKTYIHYGMDNNTNKFPTIELIAHDLDYNRQDFYTHNLWQRKNIENIILCYEDDKINIQLGTMIHDRIYLSKIDDKRVPKIIIGIYDELELSNSINNDKSEYKNIFTFGSKKDIVNNNHLINETIDDISKLIHNGYANAYFPKALKMDKRKIDEKWFNTTKFSDKLSNISQARHIDIKLKALGLRKVKVEYFDEEKLLKINRDILNNTLANKRGSWDDIYTINASTLLNNWDSKKFSNKYWETIDFETLFGKLLRSEHNRWNAHHYLDAWKYSHKTTKPKKEHNCLLPLEEFDNDNIQITAIYDMYSFLYLPNYLAQTQYRIVPYEKLSIGITGHRTLENKEKIEKIVEDEISKLNNQGGIDKIISPLAEGSDRIVANIAIKKFGANLEAPIPFGLDEYKKDFNGDDSKEEFDKILNATQAIVLSDNNEINNELRNELYKQCGEYVVDNCNVLITIWDGKVAKGIGGTGDIVQYAKDQKKYIIHINSNTLKVRYF